MVGSCAAGKAGNRPRPRWRSARRSRGRPHWQRGSGKCLRGQGKELGRHRIWGRPDHRDVLLRQRQPREHAAIGPEPLPCHPAVGALATGSSRPRRSARTPAARRRSPRPAAPASEARRRRRPAVRKAFAGPPRRGRRSAPRRRRRTSIRRTAPRRATRTPAASVVSRSALRSSRSSTIHASARSWRSYAENVTRPSASPSMSISFDRGDAPDRHTLPGTDGVQEPCAAGADRVDAQVVGHVACRWRCDRRTVGQRDAKPGARERGRRDRPGRPAPAITTSYARLTSILR